MDSRSTRVPRRFGPTKARATIGQSRYRSRNVSSSCPKMASGAQMGWYLQGMMQDSKSFYRALLARDLRFDGLFFVGVTSTRIYCRPICPVKTPKEVNCRFFKTAQEAERARFRPCLRCRPELAPGNAPVD